MRQQMSIGFLIAGLSAVAPAQDSASGPGFMIPDGSTAGASSTVTITSSFTLEDVSVTIHGFSHPWIGDLVVRLVHPAGGANGEVLLMRRPGVTNSFFPPSFGYEWDLNGNYTFSDSATTTLSDFANRPGSFVLPSGSYQPFTPFSRMDGLNSAGVWRLRIADERPGSGGSIQGWTLNLTRARGAVCLPDGSCADNLTEEEALALGGVFNGRGSACADVSCLGACFVPSSGNCVQLDAAACAGLGGVWQGLGTTSCDLCLADTNGDGVLNFFDLSAYLGLFNSQNPRADLAPPIGVFNFFDLATYLNLYTIGCS